MTLGVFVRHTFFCFITPLIIKLMTENSITSQGMPGLTIVRNAKKKKTKAKLINLKVVPTVYKVLLPPLQEGYIKAKKHDFL